VGVRPAEVAYGADVDEPDLQFPFRGEGAHARERENRENDCNKNSFSHVIFLSLHVVLKAKYTKTAVEMQARFIQAVDLPSQPKLPSLAVAATWRPSGVHARSLTDLSAPPGEHDMLRDSPPREPPCVISPAAVACTHGLASHTPAWTWKQFNKQRTDWVLGFASETFLKRRPRYSPNQRARRIDPNCCFSPARATDGSKKLPVGDGPERKSTSTRPTRSAPNST